jgi:hypothetical protein
MGMSADLEAAVASGSTMVRVGSAIFGIAEALAHPQGRGRCVVFLTSSITA